MNSLPSPTSSPSMNSTDLSTQPSRKRQRSLSMQSDTSSSSVKRSVSEGLSADGVSRSPHANHLSALSITDASLDIDSYMEGQGEADIPTTISLTPPALQNGSSSLSMTPEEKLSIVEKGKSRKMEVGETWYLVSRDWWKRWRKACTGEVDKEGALAEQDVGPVDNTRLLDQYGNLHSSLAEGVDMEYVPEEIWSHFVIWYGDAILPLPRRVVARGETKQTVVELRPPRIKVLRLTTTSGELNPDGPTHPYISISSGNSMKDLCIRLAEAVTPDSKTKIPYRVWKVETTEDDWSYKEFPVLLLKGEVVEESDKTLEEEGVESDDGFIIEFKQEDGWIIDDPLKVSNQPQRLEAPAPLFSSNSGFFDRMGNSPGTSTLRPTKAIDSYGSTRNNAMSLTSSFLSNSRNNKTLEPGTLGLGNMGNTCFMNSALQCLAHTRELSEYFLTGVYQDELNRDNPLGMHGAIAEAFGSLLHRIWADSGPSTSYSPRDFKSQLQRFAPQFSGYQQHDSQELVAFLLDGLHEDLNRVLKKPYVEKPDWEGGGDLEMVQLAQKSWDGYMMRNDSVIVDLFQGQYQSTLVCPECKKVSITFDPFMYLTLPLPVQNKWRHTIFYIPWDLEKPHVRVPVEIGREASFRDLRILLGRWMGANPDNLLTLEIFSHKFYKNLDDSVSCGDMSDNDTIVCFELPCHAQQSKSYKKQPDDPLILPLYLCDVHSPIRNTYTMNRTIPLFGYPTVVVIDREQSTDLSTIYDAVVTRLQRWTANARDLFTWEASPEDSPIQISGITPRDSLTEFGENGEVVTVQDSISDEGDIADEKSLVVAEDDMQLSTPSVDLIPRNMGAKKNIFSLRLQADHKDYGTRHASHTANNRWESWDRRTDEAEIQPELVREGDALYCEFDENVKAYYFGDTRSRWEHARWDHWEEFIHAEYKEAVKTAADKKQQGISLQDCLDEFTKEEKLGEDDLWYCPKCKKHQQATKKFDLWKVPDVLVVHLKRFSNSRTLRDKIDTFIDFPIEGLDLGDMVGERAIAQSLVEQGYTTEQLNLGDLNEPLVYDLFGVDEHIGGLGGGHYRAYALNHLSDKWYHFDDSYVTPTRATEAVNANAYLLFYRRRTASPLGGKSQEKINNARLRPKAEPTSDQDEITVTDRQLPTPPNEISPSRHGDIDMARLKVSMMHSIRTEMRKWHTNGSNAGSSAPSPPSEGPPEFEESQYDEIADDPVNNPLDSFEFPDPSYKGSPTSSNEAEADLDTYHFSRATSVNKWDTSPDSSSSGPASRKASPSSSISDAYLFDDANTQKRGDMDTTDMTHEKTA